MQSPVEYTSETESLSRLALWVDERDFDAVVFRHAKTEYLPAHWVVTLSSGGLSLREEGATLEAALARCAGRLRRLGVEPGATEPPAQKPAPEPPVAIAAELSQNSELAPEERKRDFALTAAASSARTTEFRSAEDPQRWMAEEAAWREENEPSFRWKGESL
mgnify:CR=1 FL=1